MKISRTGVFIWVLVLNLFATGILNVASAAGIGELRKWDEERMPRTQTPRVSSADSNTGVNAKPQQNQPGSLADLRRLDEIRTKQILEKQKRIDDRHKELDALIKEYSTPKVRNVVGDTGDALIDAAKDFLEGYYKELSGFPTLPPAVEVFLELIDPTETGLSPFDHARTPEELDYVNRRLREVFKPPLGHPIQKESEPASPTAQPNNPPISPSAPPKNRPATPPKNWRDPASAEQLKLVHASLTKNISAIANETHPKLAEIAVPLLNAAFLDEKINQAQTDALDEAAHVLHKLQPANICFIARRASNCSIHPIPQGVSCFCPYINANGIHNGKFLPGITKRVSMGSFCQRKWSVCPLQGSFPVGSTCHCGRIPFSNNFAVGRVSAEELEGSIGGWDD